IKRRCGDTVWKTLHHERAVGDRRQESRRDLDVVAKEVTLRELLLWPEDLVKVGDPQCVTVWQLEQTVLTAGFNLAELIEQASAGVARYIGGPQGPRDLLLWCRANLPAFALPRRGSPWRFARR